MAGGSASALSLSRPAQASHALRPAGSLSRPGATFVTRLRHLQLPARAARQLPDQSTTLRVESSSTDDPRLRGALPSYDTDTWSETSCASAFEALAEKPSSKYYPECTPFFVKMKLAYTAFEQLLTAHGIDLPKFWRLPRWKASLLKQPDALRVSPDSAQQPSRKGSSAVASDRRKRGPKTKKLERVKEDMRRDLQTRKLTEAGLRDMKEESLSAFYGVSRDTARKARAAVLSEFVE